MTFLALIFEWKVEIRASAGLLISGSQYLVLGEPIRSESCGPVCPFLSRGAERKEAWTDIDKGRPMADPCFFTASRIARRIDRSFLVIIYLSLVRQRLHRLYLCRRGSPKQRRVHVNRRGSRPKACEPLLISGPMTTVRSSRRRDRLRAFKNHAGVAIESWLPIAATLGCLCSVQPA